jgi:hypothetical protein
MRPMETVYWLRFVFGFLAALVCVGYAVATGVISSSDPFGGTTVFLNSASLAIVFYLLTYYVVKYRFRPFVQKPQKLLTTGIGVYFLSWIVFWTLLYTILAGMPPAV